MAERLALDPGPSGFNAAQMAARAEKAKGTGMRDIQASLRRQVATEADKGGRSLHFSALHHDVCAWFRSQGFKISVDNEPGRPPVTCIEW